MKMKKIYLSMAQSRAMAAEYPVGDPFGGPAYGEQNAPVVGIAMMYGAATATVTGVLSAISVGLTFASGFFTTVGSLTGDQEVMKFGSQLGMGAGLAGLGNMAMNAASGASTAGAGAAGGEAAKGATADAASQTVAGEAANTATATQGVEAANVAGSVDASAFSDAPTAAPMGEGYAGAGVEVNSSPYNALTGPELTGGFSDAPTAAPMGGAYAGTGVEVDPAAYNAGSAYDAGTNAPKEEGLISKYLPSDPKDRQALSGVVQGAADYYQKGERSKREEKIARERNAISRQQIALAEQERQRRIANANNITQTRRFAPGGVISRNMVTQ